MKKNFETLSYNEKLIAIGKYIEDNQDNIIGNYLDEEWYLDIDNHLEIIIRTDNDVYIDKYKFSIRDLKKSDAFLYAMFKDGDVNHNLGIADDKEEFRRVADWFSSDDTSLPCSPCGITNFVDGYCDKDGNINNKVIFL